MPYVSDHLTHFVGRSKPSDEERFALLIQIFRSGVLLDPSHVGQRYPVFTVMRRNSETGEENNLEYLSRPSIRHDLKAKLTDHKLIEPEIVCFCDIPFADLKIHCSKYGRFGLAFEKSFLIDQGAAAVSYVPLTGPIFTQLDEYIPNTGATNWQQAARGPRSELLEGVVHTHNWLQYQEVFLLESVIQAAKEPDEIDRVVKDLRNLIFYQVAVEGFLLGYVKFFDSSLPENDPNNYYMEREWRVAGKVRFKPEDVAKVFVPEGFAQVAREALPEIADRVMVLDAD